MRTVVIAKKKYPIRFDFGAIKALTKTIGKGTLQDLAAIQEMAVDHLPELARIGIIRGLAASEDKRPAPTADAIEKALNDRLSLMNEIIEAFGADLGGNEETNEPATEGN